MTLQYFKDIVMFVTFILAIITTVFYACTLIFHSAKRSANVSDTNNESNHKFCFESYGVAVALKSDSKEILDRAVATARFGAP